VTISGDMAMGLRKFWTEVDPNTGTLRRALGGPSGDTRFLGDLYQDLSEAARKTFALLQTPQFVADFLLHRTLEPAIASFGLDHVRLIDPTCGSGHLLLGAFERVFHHWQNREPGGKVLAAGRIDPSDQSALAVATEELLERRLTAISRVTPQFAAARRGYGRAQAQGAAARAEGLIAWLAGQPHVGAAAKKAAGIKGEVDHFPALSFLQGLLVVLRDSGHAGLVLVLGEVETLQRTCARGACQPPSRTARWGWTSATRPSGPSPRGATG